MQRICPCAARACNHTQNLFHSEILQHPCMCIGTTKPLSRYTCACLPFGLLELFERGWGWVMKTVTRLHSASKFDCLGSRFGPAAISRPESEAKSNTDTIVNKPHATLVTPSIRLLVMCLWTHWCPWSQRWFWRWSRHRTAHHRAAHHLPAQVS